MTPRSRRATSALGVACAFSMALASARCTSVLGLESGQLFDASVDVAIRACPRGRESCGGSLCDTDVMSDPHNCGACGSVCSANGAPAACVSGACSLVCGDGRLDCNHSPGDGCEIDASSDPHNCGACGHDCLGGTCAAGTCQPKLLGATALPVVDLAIGADEVIALESEGPSWQYNIAAGTLTALPLSGSGATRAVVDTRSPMYPVTSVLRAGDAMIVTDSNGFVWAGSLNLESIRGVGRTPGPASWPGLASGRSVVWVTGPHVDPYAYYAGSDGLAARGLDAGLPPDGGFAGTSIDTFAPLDAGFARAVSYGRPTVDDAVFVRRSDLVCATKNNACTMTRAIRRVELDGGASTPLWTGAPSDVTALTIDAKSIYAARPAGIFAIPRGGCPDAGDCSKQVYTGAVSDLALGDRLAVVAATNLGGSYASYSLCVTAVEGNGACSVAYQRAKTLDAAVAVVRDSPRLIVFSFGRVVYAVAK